MEIKYRYVGDDFADGATIRAFGKRDLYAADVELISPDALAHFVAVGIYHKIVDEQTSDEASIGEVANTPAYDAPPEQ